MDKVKEQKKIEQFRGVNRFLSNFFQFTIQYEDEKYASAEHLFQSFKATNEENRKKIAKALTPALAKQYGNKIECRKDWDEVRIEMMEKAVRAKFKSPHLKQMLIDTKDAILIEGNYWNDSFWGVNLETGLGENHLGKILMKIREEIKDE